MLQVECPAVQVLMAISPNLGQFLERSSSSAGRATISVCGFAALIPAFPDEANGRKYSLVIRKNEACLRSTPRQRRWSFARFRGLHVLDTRWSMSSDLWGGHGVF
jgi:hypothetical protein